MNLPSLLSFLDFRKLVAEQLQTSRPIEPDALSKLSACKQRVMESIFSVMMCSGRNAGIKRQLRQLQRESALLSNEIFAAQQSEIHDEFCEQIQKQINEVLDTLANHYPEYFDLDQDVPLYRQAKAVHVLSKKIPQLQAAMKLGEVNTCLQETVLSPYTDFVNNRRTSYKQMQYLLQHIDKLIALFKEEKSEENQLYSLVQTGFNTRGFYRYFKENITEKVYTNLTTNTQLEILYDYEKLLLGGPKKAEDAYDQSMPNCRTALLRFIKAEINCLHKKQQLHTEIVDTTHAQTASPTKYRIKTTLTVDGLAYLLRLLVEAEVIEANPRNQLIAFIASNFQTRGKGEGVISAESLSTKYRQVNQTTALNVRSVLLKMVKQAKESFNL
ncbi:MAG: hypothetical protein ACQUHE_13475 [Bacteroidia bacterium]